MKALTAILMIAGAMLALPVQAGFVNGHELMDAAREVEKAAANQPNASFYDVGRFFGYIEAVSDVFTGVRFCPSANVTVGQVAAIVIKWLEDHPEDRHYSADSLVKAALEEAFPCHR
ncbi:MAG: hypothetical protein JSW48_02125 [Betaproteobacteria bacterium]|nr:MAG: hypothetical protein JSW48_02125 [Betaproteobacteria bacterium]